MDKLPPADCPQEGKIDPMPNIDNIQKHVKILIIINQVLPDVIFRGLDDISPAMFLRHVFHYKYAIPYDQILVTSLDEQSFDQSAIIKISTKTPIADIPPLISPIKDRSQKTNEKREYQTQYQYRYFPLEQLSTMYTPIHNKLLQFNPDQDLPNTIHPFNRDELKSLNVSNEDDLFVFTIVHDSKDAFAEYPFEHIVERLLELHPRHITIFNDSCYSGSLVDITTKSIAFQKTINEKTQSQNSPEITNAVHSILTDYKSKNSLINTIFIIAFILLLLLTIASPKLGFTLLILYFYAFLSLSFIMHFLDFSEVPENITTDVKRIVSILLKNPLTRSSFVQDLDTTINNPALFAQFGEIADIFCSTDADNVTCSFPIQKLFNCKQHGSYGSMMISSVIQFLLENESLHKEAPLTKDKFLHILENSFNKVKSQYYSIMMLQNKQDQKLTGFFSQKEIPHHFSNDDSLFLSIQPSRSSTDDNFIQLDFDTIEFDPNLSYQAPKHRSSTGYGPVFGQSNSKKLCEDFAKASDLRLKYFYLYRIHFSDYYTKKNFKPLKASTSAYFVEFRQQIAPKLRNNYNNGSIYLFSGIEYMIDRYLSTFPLFPHYFVKCLVDAFNDIWDDWSDVIFLYH